MNLPVHLLQVCFVFGAALCFNKFFFSSSVVLYIELLDLQVRFRSAD